VEVRYSDYVYGLRGVNLRIERGEFVFLVGKVGAGKSTILKLLTREVRETSGSVWLRGKNLATVGDREVPSHRRELGIVPQDNALLPRKRVWENIAYAMRAIGATKQQVRRRVPEVLERVSIGHRADAFPHELSGGEQQRVAIARALINNPSLLLADEPTGNLDPGHSWEIMEVLRQLNLRGTTVLVATHDLLVVNRMPSRVVEVEAGSIASDSVPVEYRPEVALAGLAGDLESADALGDESEAETADV
jgi:cell division transport system ATP-binding protein